MGYLPVLLREPGRRDADRVRHAGHHREIEWLEAIDVDDDGQGYAFTTSYQTFYPEPPDGCEPEDTDPGCIVIPYREAVGATLYEADAVAGSLSTPINVSILVDDTGEEPDFDDADSCLAIDYSAGIIMAACNIYDYEDSGNDYAYIGEVDPGTGRLYPDPNGVLGGIAEDPEFIEFEAIAKSPLTGKFVGFDARDNAVYEWLKGTLPVSPGSADFAVFAADYDRDGTLWVSVVAPDAPVPLVGPGESGLATFDFASGDFPFSEVWSDPFAIINALTVWGKPTLPATGPAESSAIAVGAAGFLLLGAILAVGATARRRETES